MGRQPTRNHIFAGLTRGLCPVCRRVVDAQVLLRAGAVYLRKRCPEHGWHEALVASDAGWYVDAFRYNKPGAVPYRYATEVERGCPDDCGLCPEHQQHTCVGVLEITGRCNLRCPVCFADAGDRHTDDLSVEQVAEILNRFVEAEGQPEVLQISGGEPTLHPALPAILAEAKARDIRHVMLNTNGLRLAEDDQLLAELAPFRPTIYLQFDGLRAETHRALRGRDLREIKQRALDRLAEAGLYAVLVATVARGVNEDELGDILRFGLDHPAVLGVSYQPITYAGRSIDAQPQQRITVPDVLHGIEAQTGGLFTVSDFRPVPCPYPTCTACTYAVIDGDAVHPLPRLLDVDEYLDFVTNRAAPDLSMELQPVLEALWSSAAVMGTEKTTENLSCAACGVELPIPTTPEALRQHFFMIQVHAFMDAHTFDLQRLMKCCIHQLLPDGRAVPFCAYNVLGYREEVRG